MLKLLNLIMLIFMVTILWGCVRSTTNFRAVQISEESAAVTQSHREHQKNGYLNSKMGVEIPRPTWVPKTTKDNLNE